MIGISFSNISKTYPGGKLGLADVDLSLPSGNIIAFIGSNGSGKSTALKVLAGLLPPDKGIVDFLGIDPYQEAKQIRQMIGFVAQDVGLDGEITGLESLSLFASLYGVNGKDKREVIDRLCDEYRLNQFVNDKVKTYSGGMRQRLHLALSVIHSPPHLFLDEPTNSLDPEGRQFIWQKIQHYRGQTVIVVTHDLIEASRYCDHVVLFHQGSVLTNGSPQEIIAADESIQLQIIYQGSIDDSLSAELKALRGVKRMSITPEVLMLSIDHQISIESEIIDLLKINQLQLIEVRKHHPDLSTAYFNLTGELAVSKKENGQKKKRKK